MGAQPAIPINQPRPVQTGSCCQALPSRRGTVPERRRIPRVPLLEVKYGGDPKDLRPEDFSTDWDKVGFLISLLSGSAARWDIQWNETALLDQFQEGLLSELLDE
uniref:Uncharacterized protein n=1 Tax=Naja naja TaxID=35670 RepID=A0A8C6Y382_NAJNA